MDRIVDVAQYQPELVKEVREFQALAKAESEGLIPVWEKVEWFFKNQFIESLTEEGCSRWEKILEYVAKPTDALEKRRERIYIRINENLPYTYRMLERQLSLLCSETGYEIELKNEEYFLGVFIRLAFKNQYQEAERMVKRMVPANLILTMSLLFNRHKVVGQYQHLSLEKYTHRQIREEPLKAGTKYGMLIKQKNEELEKVSHEMIKNE